MNKLISILLLFLILGLFSTCSPSPEDERPNVIIIFMDDMGYGDLENYGNPLIKTPNLNALADEGIRFTSFYAASAVCTPSRAGLLTGRYPVRNAPFNFGPESTGGLPLSETTMADLFQKAGYKTAAVGKWHLGHFPDYLPTNRGFDSFYGLPYSNDMIRPWVPWVPDSMKLNMYENEEIVWEVGKDQDDLTIGFATRAIDFIRESKDEPFFLYLAQPMPHLPISTSEEFIGTSESGLYGDVIETVDWTVGEIKNTLKELGIEEQTLIIFTSDNGPWHNLPDRMLADGVEHWHTGSSGPLRGAKTTTYEGGLRVPAIFNWPGVIPPDQVNRELVTTLDILPTLASIANIELPDSLKLDGYDMLPVLKGESSSPRNEYIYTMENRVEAVRRGEWKLRYTEQGGVELYNLNLDVSEKYNRADEHPEMVAELLQTLRDFAEQTNSYIYSE